MFEVLEERIQQEIESCREASETGFLECLATITECYHSRLTQAIIESRGSLSEADKALIDTATVLQKEYALGILFAVATRKQLTQQTFDFAKS